MASIRFISTSIIQAESPKKEICRIELTPWDLQHLLVGYLQGGLLFHKPKPQEEEPENGLIQHLKASLSRTLDFFAPLAGRLATIDHDDKTTSFFIDCNNAGALFVHAVAERVKISDLIEPGYVPEILYSFFQLDGVKNIEGTSKPLLAVQVTELVDGIFIACSMNHSVVDGTSFWHFFNSWSEISRGNSDHLSKPPIFQRQFVDGIDYPIRIPQILYKQIQDEFIPPLLQIRVFHFRKQDILKIKTKANVEMNTDKISSLQAVLSHFWLSIMRNRHLDQNQETMIFIVIGVRQKLLPEQYFGNAVQSAVVTMKAGELVEKGLGNAAWQINKIIANHKEEKELMKFLESWVNSPRFYQTGQMMNNALLTGSSPRFDVYGNDFGWGRPIAARDGASSKRSGLLLASGGVEEGSIEIKVCLSPETFHALENDEQFMAAFTI